MGLDDWKEKFDARQRELDKEWERVNYLGDQVSKGLLIGGAIGIIGMWAFMIVVAIGFIVKWIMG